MILLEPTGQNSEIVFIQYFDHLKLEFRISWYYVKNIICRFCISYQHNISALPVLSGHAYSRNHLIGRVGSDMKETGDE